jgi:hypothetical protein
MEEYIKGWGNENMQVSFTKAGKGRYLIRCWDPNLYRGGGAEFTLYEFVELFKGVDLIRSELGEEICNEVFQLAKSHYNP